MIGGAGVEALRWLWEEAQTVWYIVRHWNDGAPVEEREPSQGEDNE